VRKALRCDPGFYLFKAHQDQCLEGQSYPKPLTLLSDWEKYHLVEVLAISQVGRIHHFQETLEKLRIF
jgi:hypothetical protein